MRRFVVLLSLLCCAVPLAAQVVTSSLTITRDGVNAGLERYTVSPGTDAGSSTITSVAKYPAAQPTEQYQATLEQDRDHRPATFILIGDGGQGPVKALAGLARGRLTIKTSRGQIETGRELPASPNMVLLDERLLAFYLPVAALATADGATLTGVYPRTGRVVTFTARLAADPQGGVRTVTLTGGLTGTITLGASGEITRIDLPSEHVVAARVPS